MTIRDLKQIGIWAAITALLVVGVLASRSAIGDDPASQPKKPSVTIGNCTVTATAAAADEPYKVAITLSATNDTPETQQVDVEVALVRSEFTGSMLSRVVSEDDYKYTTERTETVHFEVAGSKAASKTITMTIDARPPAEKSVLLMAPSYVVRTGTEKPVDLARFSANLAWPPREKE